MDRISNYKYKGFEMFTISQTCTFYFHPCNDLGIHLVLPLFDNTRFVIWRKHMHSALLAKNKMGIVICKFLNQDQNLISPINERCNDIIIIGLLTLYIVY